MKDSEATRLDEYEPLVLPLHHPRMVTTVPAKGTTVDDFLEWHRARVLRRKGKEPAASTMRSMRGRLRSALRVSGTDELSVLATQLTDVEQAETLLDRLALTNSPGSLRLVYEACKCFHSYARAQGWVDDALAMTPPGKNPQKPITVFTADEVKLIVSSARAKSLRWWAFLATLSRTGRRIGEVLGLEWELLHLDRDPAHFELLTTKNGTQQYVPLGSMLTDKVFTPDHVEQLRNEPLRRFGRSPAEYPFPWTYNCAEKMLRHHCEMLGVPHRGFHCFRHTKATELLAKGVPIQAVSRLLGHANSATTDRIYHHATALNYAQYVD